MKATPIVLSPELEPAVRRVAIGAGQPEYTVIPAIVVGGPDEAPGLNGFVSRWEFSPAEKNAVARSELRAILHAFASWLHEQIQETPTIGGALGEPDGDVTLGTAVHRFIHAHASQLEGEDAALWYTRLIPPTDSYQPQQMEIGTVPPIQVRDDVAVQQMPSPGSASPVIH